MKRVPLYSCLLATDDICVNGSRWYSFTMNKDTVTVIANGREYELANQPVVLDENGSCIAADVDGNHVVFTFRVNRGLRPRDL